MQIVPDFKTKIELSERATQSYHTFSEMCFLNNFKPTFQNIFHLINYYYFKLASIWMSESFQKLKNCPKNLMKNSVNWI